MASRPPHVCPASRGFQLPKTRPVREAQASPPSLFVLLPEHLVSIISDLRFSMPKRSWTQMADGPAVADARAVSDQSKLRTSSAHHSLRRRQCPPAHQTPALRADEDPHWRGRCSPGRRCKPPALRSPGRSRPVQHAASKRLRADASTPLRNMLKNTLDPL